MYEHWQIAVKAPIFDLLTYLVPSEIQAQPGQQVKIPLGKRNSLGVLIHKVQNPIETSSYKIKPILERNLNGWQIPPLYLKWLLWLSEYYLYPPGLVLDLSFPNQLKKESDNFKKTTFQPSSIQLNFEQDEIYKKINSSQGFEVHLIHGVTGSGKTEIYLELFQSLKSQNKQGLFLLPEISLTPQMLDRFSARFPEQISLLHSQLTPAKKRAQWWRAHESNHSILIGARSALFCPLPQLGLIIIDEEHDSSFKQDTKLRYHARNAAIMLGKMANIPVILGSATPSGESWLNCQEGKYQIHTLKKRARALISPEIQLIDMKKHKENKTLPSWLSPQLFEHILLTLNKKDQVALFLNRRGLASVLFCDECGYHKECPNCDISLTLHHNNMLVCHYCSYQESKPSHCPSCKEGVLSPFGLGTEQIESDLKQLLPEARIARIDRDEVSHISQLENTIKQVEKREIDVLIGTQMISKGLDFPSLKLVGFILADIGLHAPDFRSQEKVFQLLQQMAGRAGRHAQSEDEKGRVLVQTYFPEHPLFNFLLLDNYSEFMRDELSNRAELNYPPHGKLAAFQIQGRNQEKVHETANRLHHIFQVGLKSSPYQLKIQILGPAQAPLSRLRNKFRYHLIIKTDQDVPLSKICHWAHTEITKKIDSGIDVYVDIDPQHLI